MEIFGGFMVMLSIVGFFLTVVWLIFPFVVFAMKGKLDRTYILLEEIDRRLSAMEARLAASQAEPDETVPPASVPHSQGSSPLPPSPPE